MGASMRTPEYIQNYFASIKRIPKPPDARNLKYTVDIPLKRPDILPKEILQLASPVNFEKISASKSFEIEKELLKGIRHFWSHEKVINAQCARMDLNKRSGPKQKTITVSKGTP